MLILELLKALQMETLDAIDRTILTTLQENGRITNKELSEKVGLSPPPMLERVKKLERQGYIKKYVALLDAEKVGCGTMAFVSVSMAEHSAKSIEDFRQDVERFPEVLECYHLAGNEDYLLKVATKNMNEYESFIVDKLTTVKNLGKVRTAFVLSTVKHETKLPIS